MDETGPSVWDRLIAEVDQIISIQHNQTFANALQRLLDCVNILRTNLHNQTSPQLALNNLLNISIFPRKDTFLLKRGSFKTIPEHAFFT